MFRRRSMLVWTIAIVVTAGAVTFGMTARAAYESAPYTVLEKSGKIEIREYPDLVLAATQSRFEAQGRDGSFMKLFRYISGGNQSRQKIAMTTPVFMGSPDSDNADQMGFVMPSKVAVVGAPAPTSSDVNIQIRKGGRFAVIRFSGVMNSNNAAAEETKLRGWLKERGMKASPASERAGYDAPFTPGIFRRNEVLIRLLPEEIGEDVETSDP